MEMPRFRVWHQMKESFDSKTKQWSYSWRMSLVQIINVTAGEVTIESKYGFGNRLYKVGDKCILMQSVGVRDLGGNPVFLGDIVRVTDRCSLEKFTGVVEEKHGMRFIQAQEAVLREWENYDVEVLGNKYESPDLLDG